MKKTRIVTILIIAALTVLETFMVVHSAGVVQGFPVSDSTAKQSRPGLAYNSKSNQFLVVWEDYRAPVGFGSDVYGQLVNDDGSMTGVNFPISTVSDWQRDPKAAYNPVTNKYLVVWEDWRIDSDDNIYAQMVNADGSMAGSEFSISTATNDQSNPDIVYNSSTNQFLVVFDDDRLVAYDYDIYGQLVNADGSLSGDDFPVSIPSEDQILPVVAFNSTNNQFMIVWEDERNTPTSESDIYARIVNADGSLDGGDFSISATSEADQVHATITYDSASNQYFVAWEHDTDIYGRLINADKTFAGSEFEISTDSGVQSDPAVSFDSANNQFLVAWSDSYGWDNIYARLVSADGSMGDPQFEFVTGTGDYFYPDMVFNSSTNQFLVVWRNETCFNSFDNCEDNDIDIYGALYPETATAQVRYIYIPLVLQNADSAPSKQ